MTARQLVKRMMRMRPVSSDRRAVNRLVDFVRDYLRKRKVHTRVEKHEGRKILYGSTTRGKTSKILLNPHLDVVPADDDMFKPREKGGRIYGRGAGDCLGNCAVGIRLLDRLRGKADVGVVFSTDEELGGHTAERMVKLGYRAGFVIITDGGAYRIAVAQKGVHAVRLTATGKACHGSTPWRGDNAIERLIRGYVKVKKLFPPVRRDSWKTTMSPNVIKAGTVFNRVPDRAEMILDIRYTEDVSPGALVRKIRSVSGLKVSPVETCPVVFCDEKDPRIRGLARHMERVFRRKIRMVRMMGATDARHFKKLKVPVAIIGVPSKGAHSTTEWVSVRGMEHYEDMLYDYCLEKG
jgi:succinyl-diaminopimelate desuccinylase